MTSPTHVTPVTVARTPSLRRGASRRAVAGCRRWPARVVRSAAREKCAERSDERAAFDRGRDGIHGAEAAGHLRRTRTVIDIRRGAELHETAVRQHANAVGDPHRLARIVRDQDRRRARAPQEIDRLFPDLIAQPRVEAREWFVHRAGSAVRGASARASATRCRSPPDSMCG